MLSAATPTKLVCPGSIPHPLTASSLKYNYRILLTTVYDVSVSVDADRIRRLIDSQCERNRSRCPAGYPYKLKREIFDKINVESRAVSNLNFASLRVHHTVHCTTQLRHHWHFATVLSPPIRLEDRTPPRTARILPRYVPTPWGHDWQLALSVVVERPKSRGKA